MTQNIVAQFPTVPKADLLHGDSCAICHEAYATEAAVRLPCGHEFGLECISTWLSPERGRGTCPLCRHQLLPVSATSAEEEEREEELSLLWENIVTAIETEIELTQWAIAHPPRVLRECLLYKELRDRGANLPPYRPHTGDPANITISPLDPVQEEAFFRLLCDLGAFLVIPIEVGPLVTVREVWHLLREQGYWWDGMLFVDSADHCGWTLE